MATIYTDLHNRAKENISVIRKPGTLEDGMTQQHVNFLNPHNEYNGTFHGNVDAVSANIKNAIIDDSTIKNSVLDNVYLKSKIDGEPLNLDGIGAAIETLNDKIDTKTADLKDYIDAEIANRKECAARLANCLSTYANDICSYLDNKISVLSDDVYQLSIDLIEEISNRISADEQLSNDLTSFIINERHYDLRKIDKRFYPYQMKDFAVNTLNTDEPNAYVYVNDIIDPIGIIKNCVFEPIKPVGTLWEQPVKQFELQIVPSMISEQLSALSTDTFRFDNDHTEYLLDENTKIVWEPLRARMLSRFSRQNAIVIKRRLCDYNDNCIWVEDNEISFRIDDNDLAIAIKLPNKKEDIPNKFEKKSEEFILNIKVNGPDITGPEHTQWMGECPCQYDTAAIKFISNESNQVNTLIYLDNIIAADEDVNENKFHIINIPLNNWLALKFTEVQPHVFIVQDLNDTELIARTDDLEEKYQNLKNKFEINNADLISLSNQVSAVSSNFQEHFDSVDLSVDILNNEKTEISNNLSTLSVNVLNKFDNIDLSVNNLCTEIFELSNLTINKFADIDLSVDKFDSRISANENNISEIYERIRNGIVYKGTINCDVQVNDHYDLIETISGLFVGEKNISINVNDYTADTVLSAGYLYIVKQTTGSFSTHFVVEGLEIEVGDQLIIKNTNKISDLTSADVDIFDAMDDNVVTLKLAKELSTNILHQIDSISSFLSTEILSNDNDISDISSDLGNLSARYIKVFQNEEKIDADVPVLTDESNKIKYTMHLSAGTIVLVPIK